MKNYKIVFLFVIVFWLFSIPTHALPTRVYLNDTDEISIPGTTPAYLNSTLDSNLTVNESINFTFEAKVADNGKLDAELTNSNNKSNYLLRIRIDDQGGFDPLQQIFRIGCNNASVTSLF